MKDKCANSTLNINAIWRVAVSAIFFTIVLTISIRPLVMGEAAYRKIEGEIVSSFQGDRRYYIRLNTSRDSYIIRGNNNEKFREKAPVGGKATIRYKRIINFRLGIESGSFSIRKMIVNDEVVIPLNKKMGANAFLVFAAGLLFVGSVVDFSKNRDR